MILSCPLHFLCGPTHLLSLSESTSNLSIQLYPKLQLVTSCSKQKCKLKGMFSILKIEENSTERNYAVEKTFSNISKGTDVFFFTRN